MSKAKKYVQEYITKMNEQSNRCTSTPYYFCICDYEYIPSYHQSEWDMLCATNDDNESYEGKSFKELFLSVYTHCHQDEEIVFDFDLEDNYETEGKLEALGFNVFRQKEKEVYKGVFFTETDAENHLKSNKHHYSKKANVYVEHAWRAPELEKFFKSIGELCGVPFNEK